MLKLAVSILLKEKQKTIVTVSAVGMVLMLMMFLSGIYEGVKTGVSSFVSHSSANIWMCQKNSTNLIRSSSFIDASIANEIGEYIDAEKVEKILRIITTATINGKTCTLFAFGIQPNSQLSKPLVTQGSFYLREMEIILDVSFARNHNLKLNETILIQNKKFKIVGFSEKTNATVAQFSFIQLDDAQELLGYPNIVSFILIKKNNHIIDLLSNLNSKYKEYAFYSKSKFIENNIKEMETGVLPILFTIAILGIVTGGMITTLMLFSSIIERREDYALLKAVGMSQLNLNLLVLFQSLMISNISYFIGVVAYSASSQVLVYFVPIISLETTTSNLLLILILSNLVGASGSIASVRKLAKVFPAEVFRA